MLKALYKNWPKKALYKCSNSIPITQYEWSSFEATIIYENTIPRILIIKILTKIKCFQWMTYLRYCIRNRQSFDEFVAVLLVFSKCPTVSSLLGSVDQSRCSQSVPSIGDCLQGSRRLRQIDLSSRKLRPPLISCSFQRYSTQHRCPKPRHKPTEIQNKLNTRLGQ
jgi:hypothetical protein